MNVDPQLSIFRGPCKFASSIHIVGQEKRLGNTSLHYPSQPLQAQAFQLCFVLNLFARKFA